MRITPVHTVLLTGLLAAFLAFQGVLQLRSNSEKGYSETGCEAEQCICQVDHCSCMHREVAALQGRDSTAEFCSCPSSREMPDTFLPTLAKKAITFHNSVQFSRTEFQDSRSSNPGYYESLLPTDIFHPPLIAV